MFFRFIFYLFRPSIYHYFSLFFYRSSVSGLPSPVFRLRSSVSGLRSPVSGHRSSVIGHRSSVIGHRSSVIGHRSSVFRHRSSVIGLPSSIFRHRSSVFRHRSSVIGLRSSVLSTLTASSPFIFLSHILNFIPTPDRFFVPLFHTFLVTFSLLILFTVFGRFLMKRSPDFWGRFGILLMRCV